MAAFSTLPTVTARLSLVLSASVSADIATHWQGQRIGSPGTLAADLAAADTVLTFAPGAPASLGLGFAPLAAGQTILIDAEAMLVQAVEGNQATVARNVAPLAPPVSDHAAGAAISTLKYPDPWLMIADEALRPWAQQVVIGLGANSATFGAHASGSLSITGAPGA